MKLGIVKLETKVKADYNTVIKAFTDREGKLFEFLLPVGCKIVHYKGLRRGAIIKLKILGEVIKFKNITYTSTKDKTLFNDIFKDGEFLGIKFWSHRHKIINGSDTTTIIDEITFTTRNKKLDLILHAVIASFIKLRWIRYKLFFRGLKS
jgi:ligand-binding SRPBCC domain-containing protein